MFIYIYYYYYIDKKKLLSGYILKRKYLLKLYAYIPVGL